MLLNLFIFIVTVILFVFRVYFGTLSVFSKRKRELKIEKTIENNKKNIRKNITHYDEETYRNSAKVVTVFEIIVCIIYYYIVFCQKYSGYITITSLIQIALTLYSFTTLKAVGSCDKKDYDEVYTPFIEWVNMILDYVYYPVVIYYLIISPIV